MVIVAKEGVKVGSKTLQILHTKSLVMMRMIIIMTIEKILHLFPLYPVYTVQSTRLDQLALA